MNVDNVSDHTPTLVVETCTPVHELPVETRTPHIGHDQGKTQVLPMAGSDREGMTHLLDSHTITEPGQGDAYRHAQTVCRHLLWYHPGRRGE